MADKDFRFGEEAPLVGIDEFKTWILVDDEDLLVVNKPGWFVCHPSKNGPFSSLVGVVREFTGLEKMHLVARLDRETSGLVLFAKRPAIARRYQMAIQERRVRKAYLAILCGEFSDPVHVDEPLGRDADSAVYVKQCVKRTRSSQRALTDFEPLATGGGYTLCRVLPETGRKHQIRAHALWMGHSIVGDKIYGPDETLYLEFIEKGWTDRLATELPLFRQALHCHRLEFDFPEGEVVFTAPVFEDMASFCEAHIGVKC